MAVVARGSLADRSAPRLVAALATRAFTGELVIEASGRAYRLAWAYGALVGAQSPHPADSAAKVALTLGVLSSTQAGEVARIIAATPGVDEMEVVAQTARLSTELIGRLARRLAGARAARAMSVETGSFVIDDEQPYWGNVTPVDARWVLYSGLRQHFTFERAARELAGLASAVRLREGVDLDGFGFDEPEAPVLARLRAGELALAPLPPGLDPQVAQAVVLALLLGGEVEVARAPVPVAASVTPVAPPTRVEPSGSPPASPGPGTTQPMGFPTRATPAHGLAAPAVPARAASPSPAAASAQPDKIRALIAERLAVLDGTGDHFALLGVAPEAGPDEIRTRYFALARHLHPDRLKAAGVEDETKEAQRLFARMNEAFTVLTDPDKRAKYQQVMRAGGEAAVRAREAATEAAVRRALDAEERFRLGEMALRRQQLELALREFQRAVELDPEEADHHAMLGWTTYVAAANKASATPVARGHLQRALEKNPKSVTAYLALGRLARMEGHDGEALKHFQQAVKLEPGNQEATVELRGIESRGKAGDAGEKKGGFFGKSSKKP